MGMTLMKLIMIFRERLLQLCEDAIFAVERVR